MSALVQNTAGETEREARSRRANLIEALAIASGLLLLLWPISFGIGVLEGKESVKSAVQWPLIALFCWLMLGSALWHRDSATSLGFGSPVAFWRAIRQPDAGGRWRVLGPAILVFSIFFLASVAFWPETAKMFRLGSAAREWPIQPGGAWKVFLFSGLVSAVLACWAVRYDNLFSACWPIAIASVALLGYAVAGALLNHGTAAFDRIDPAQYPFDVLAYALWGMTQQYLFTSWFSTRLRKGIPPGPTPRLIDSQGRGIIYGGVAGALLLAMPMWLVVRSLFGAEQAPIPMLLWFLVFAFPVGAVWMHFYQREPRRMLVATLSGSFFGLIHIDSYGLVLVTFWLGTIFSYLFMEDRFRNLAVIGFAHGLLGSTFGKLFKNTAAGPLRINYRVGPWSVEEPAAHVLIVPVICIVIYVLLLIWVCRSRIFAPVQRIAPDSGSEDLELSGKLNVAAPAEAPNHT